MLPLAWPELMPTPPPLALAGAGLVSALVPVPLPGPAPVGPLPARSELVPWCWCWPVGAGAVVPELARRPGAHHPLPQGKSHRLRQACNLAGLALMPAWQGLS